ncbi:phosphotransferase family protein [Dactylosporangium fulvum]|uniref:Aminoglycoside phosphotransferase family protein n=1 Tax=Dactylosporangium fulvum TaxID=53359 RepID=A0ABY5W682_9ACTN|nr:aminoglycoside phosphotransferase family protein [Dactylosporangium fulvum]UWP85495.1 aminoglycoside phosphotransferase family protein [Dactylosporangium fulvum]
MPSTEITTEIPAPLGREQPQLAQLLDRPGTRVVLLAGSRNPNAKITLILLDDYGPSFVIKVPTTRDAAQVVQNEGTLLRQLADLGLGRLATTLPRPIGYLASGALPALASTALVGTQMAVRYHAWRHTARQRRVRADFTAAGDWLADLQRRTAGQPGPVTLLADCLDAIEARFADHPDVAMLRARLATAAGRLAGEHTPRTVVHGDYWFGNLLVDRGRVVGVVDWECGDLAGEPLRDVARFAVSYALYLDRHVRPGARVPGHRGLYADRWGAGIAHAVAGRGWFGALVREHVSGALERLGVSGERWRDLLIAGVAEIAATADHPDFARAHLDLLVAIVRSDGIGEEDSTAAGQPGPADPPQPSDAADGNEPAGAPDAAGVVA